MLTEAVLTLGLVSVILGTASGARNVGINGAIAVGAYWAGVGLGGAGLGRVDEPGLLAGSRADCRGPHQLLDLPGRPDHRGDDRGRRSSSSGKPTKAGAEAAQGPGRGPEGL